MGSGAMHVAITGASSGIGEAIARAYAAAGHRVTLVARRRELLEALAAEIGPGAHVEVADMANPAASVDWIGDAEAALGPIDVLVLNAGVQPIGPALDLDDAGEEALFAVNLRAPIRIARRIVPDMLARGGGTVVVVASIAGLVNTPQMAHYNASKAGVAAWFETLGDELRDTPVKVCTVYPGPVETAMERAAHAKIGPNAAADALPTGTPEELAELLMKAVAKGRARLIYPRVYGVLRFARVTSQWFTSRFAPR
ncbi:MAG: SDR family NAD(P)-dependent oxidoreductase [Deltaproteobacteria bacterium]|nr:MAG: SDR family NAD(P)-dependent oxidoreductase [Deltaproteobacteria bacterium]